MPLDSDIFRCYASKAVIAGKEVRIGVDEAEVIKRDAVFHGFTGGDGQLRPDLSWMEKLVILLRDVTSAEDFNHEYWAAEVSKPDWMRSLDRICRKSWFYFPDSPEDLTPINLGKRIGEELGLQERYMEYAAKEGGFRELLHKKAFEEAARGIDVASFEKVELVIPGFPSDLEYVTEQSVAFPQLRRVIVELVNGNASREEFADFFAGYAQQEARARAINLEDFVSDFVEKEEVTRILSDCWDEVDRLKNRAEISEFIRGKLPLERQKFL